MRLLSLASAAALVLVAASASGQSFVGNTVSTFESDSEGNIPEEPDEVIVAPAVGPTECTDSGWSFQNRQWSFPPTSQGGPVIAPGALVELRLRAFDAGAAFGARTLRVEVAN